MDDTTSPTDGTVADLKDHIATVDDPAQLDAIKEQEEANKARTTALAAIEARKAELASGDAPAADVSAIEPVPDTDRKTDPNAQGDGNEAVTTLAQVNVPEAMTDDEINAISGGGLKPDVTGPRADVAEQLKITRDMARDPEAEHPYAGSATHGFGPGAEIG